MHGKGSMSKVMKALGLMSGTSLDGIDVAMIETDGEHDVRRGPSETFAYDERMRGLLSEAIEDASSLKSREERPHTLAVAETEITEHHAAAVKKFLAGHNIDRASIDVIGFHGQTVLHRQTIARFVGTTAPVAVLDGPRVVPFVVNGMMTVQLGLGSLLADLTQRPVVYDLRAADVEAGGQGAPLVPVYHRAVTAKLPQRPLAIVNIGGVSNVTFIGEEDSLLAFDTGPGNALLDDWTKRHFGFSCDENGAVSATGEVIRPVLLAYLNHSYFAELPPKSLDRNDFTVEYAERLSPRDGAATLAALTANSIAKAREHLPMEPQLWIVCGGGRKNRTIMKTLAGLVEHAVVPAEAVGLNGDSIEAEAWAYLAVRSLKGLPLTYPGTTGVLEPTCGGLSVNPNLSAIH